MTRTVTTDIHSILDIALLTDEDLGTTGALVRSGLYAMCGNSISDIEVKEHVKRIIDRQIECSGKTEQQLADEWRDRQKKAHPRLTDAQIDARGKQECAEEEAHHLHRVREVVRLMRAGH